MSALARDPVFRILLVVLAALALFDGVQLLPGLVFTVTSMREMLPFLLLAVGFAASARATGADQLVARAFSGSPLRTIVLAALVGAMSPFCSCGVIPLIAAMLGAGVPLAPVMAFWIASPIMDPEMFILTAAGIGTNFALAKTLAAFSMGLLAGTVILWASRLGLLGQPLQSHLIGGCAKTCASTGDGRVHWLFWRQSGRLAIFKAEALAIGLFLGKWLTLAFLLESLMLAYVSTEWIVTYVGPDNPLAIPLAAVVGIPSYLNGYAAIPLISGLLDMGMTPGAAMAFITAGAVSSIPAAIAVFALVRKPVFVLYMVLGLVGSILSAWVYQLSGGAL